MQKFHFISDSHWMQTEKFLSVSISFILSICNTQCWKLTRIRNQLVISDFVNAIRDTYADLIQWSGSAVVCFVV